MQIETKDGRIFKFEGEEPYRRANGSLTVLRLWSSSCVQCEELFVVKTPSTVSELHHSSSFGSKHCHEHKLAITEVKSLMVNGKFKAMSKKALVSSK